MHLERPLHQRPCDHWQVGPQDRLGCREALLVLAGGDQDRRARLLGVVEHAERVTEARRGVEIAHRELAGSLRIAVRHRHDRGLLQAEQITDLGLGREGIHQRQLGSARVTEHELHALLLEELEQCFLSGHYRHGRPPYCGRNLASWPFKRKRRVAPRSEIGYWGAPQILTHGGGHVYDCTLPRLNSRYLTPRPGFNPGRKLRLSFNRNCQRALSSRLRT